MTGVGARRSLVVESLEDRMLLAGNVSVDVVAGDLWILGDATTI
jgi:hypothetical protein